MAAVRLLFVGTLGWNNDLNLRLEDAFDEFELLFNLTFKCGELFRFLFSRRGYQTTLSKDVTVASVFSAWQLV